MPEALHSWFIQRDIEAETDLNAHGIPGSYLNAIGVTGPGYLDCHSVSLTTGEIPLTKRHFRLYDDDGTLYYEGVQFLADDADEEDEFAPLHDFGMPNAGAVRMDILDEDEWKTL